MAWCADMWSHVCCGMASAGVAQRSGQRAPPAAGPIHALHAGSCNALARQAYSSTAGAYAEAGRVLPASDVWCVPALPMRAVNVALMAAPVCATYSIRDCMSHLGLRQFCRIGAGICSSNVQHRGAG
jgi:hypothetical protein